MILPISIETRKSLEPPVALITLIAVNIWFQVFVVLVDTYPLMDAQTFVDWFAFDPDKPTLSGLVLSMFTHSGWVHLAGNMFFLWVFGWVLEDRLGWKKFTYLYLGLGIAGSLVEMGVYWGAYLYAPGRVSMPGIGASGCVMAILGVTLTRYYNLKVRVLNPLVAPLILWLVLMAFVPSWRDWLVWVFFFNTPLAYLLPVTGRKLVFRIPLWALAPYYFIGDYATVLKGQDDGVDHVIHVFCFLAGLGAGWLMKLPQENVDEGLLERAQEDARQGLTHIAVSEYVEYLRRYPDDANARAELADTYLGQGHGRFWGQGSREKALFQYQWALETWLQQGRELDAVKLFRSLRGTFQDPEFRPALLRSILALGEKDKTLSMKAADRRSALEEEVRRLYGNRQYPTAHAALNEWWKLGQISDSDPLFLSLAAEVFHRTQDKLKEEQILEYLAEKGDVTQAARALGSLYKLWMGSPKQLQLRVVFRHALERLPDLRLNHEVEELAAKVG